MSSGQLLSVQLDSGIVAGQLLAVTLESPTVSAVAGQLLSVSLTTPPFTVVTLGSARTVDPLELVTIDAAWTGATPTTFTWSIVSNTTGVTPTLHPDGAQLTFTAPASEEGGVVTIGLTTFNGSTTSTLATVAVTVYPQNEWILIASTWRPFAAELIP